MHYFDLSTCKREIFTVSPFSRKLFYNYFTFNLLSEIFARKGKNAATKKGKEKFVKKVLSFSEKYGMLIAYKNPDQTRLGGFIG